MNITITPSALSGRIKAIASKSQAHRLLICAAFSDKTTSIVCGETSEDINATLECLTELGAVIKKTDGGYRVTPLQKGRDGCTLNCGESGSTLRFLLPTALALGVKAEFNMRGNLPKRPLSPLYEEMLAHGCTLSEAGVTPLIAQGKLTSGGYALPANISSQFISGLLFALPLLDGDSTIELIGRIESKSYIDMTCDALSKFKIDVRLIGNCFYINGNQKYISPRNLTVEGDWSNSAFWLCAAAVSNNEIACTGQDINSKQGDKAIIEILEQFGAKVVYGENSITVSHGKLRGITVDASDIPDLVPIIAAVAAVSEGQTVIENAQRLRIKESDRLRSVTKTLSALGATIKETDDGLLIYGRLRLNGGVIDSHNDHRIAMMAAIASIVCSNPVTIKNAEAVNKSYPGFWKDFKGLGGKAEVNA